MSHRNTVLALALAAAAGTFPLLAAGNFTPGTVPGTFVGKSSSQTPYVEPTAPGWEVISLLTVGDSHNNYRMAGVPDGLGALAGQVDGKGRVVADKALMTVVMNQEFGKTLGVSRAHGAKGAFVSQWTFNLNSLAVTGGQDLIQEIYAYNGGSGYSLASLAASAVERFCSADLPPMSAFYNPVTGTGYSERIFMNGEETGGGRAFANIVTGPEKGRSYEFGALGNAAWENVLAHPGAGDTTVVIGMADSTPGKVYFYKGTKQSFGSPMEKAGLHGGMTQAVRVIDGGPNYGGGLVSAENNGAIDGAFVLDSVANGTGFARPEDGAWDTQDPKVFYFVTTGATLGGNPQASRLYRLTFDSVTAPTGGTIELVVESASLIGTDGDAARTFDNITVDDDGFVLVQEDPGGSSYIAKTWRVDPSDGSAVQIVESDRDRFLPSGSIGPDEESSGIIEVTDIIANANWYQPGRRYYLGVMQAHSQDLDTELLEGGQLYLLISPAS